MLTLELFEELEGPPEPTLIDALRDFLPLAVKHLKMEKLPKIKLLRDVETEHMPSFGKFSNDDRTVHLGIKNRHPNDILRTLAHEMVHYVQGEQDRLDADSGATGSTEEDEANAEAGVIMRKFNQQFPQYIELKPIVFEEWSKKYKKNINCSNPKGFSQKAHCAGRKKNTKLAEGLEKECPPATQDIALNLKNRQKAINEYHYGPLNPNLPNDEYWAELADKWNTTDIDSVKQNRCGNCGAFDVSKDMQACIAKGIGSEPGSSAMDAVDAGQLGYCKFLKFKCASKRTCDAWIEGGPITEQLDENQEKYIIYLNDKPVSTYPTNREAEYQAKMILQKFPTAKIDIKKEVCTLSPVQLEENLRSIAEGQHCDAKNAVPELKAALTKRKTQLKNADAKTAYDKIDKIMTRIAHTYNISGQKLHDLWTERYGEIPDTWVLDENFADGKGPGRPGDSQRHGIPKGATIAQLEKAAKAPGRKGQLARWQINMRRGKKK
jgi:hypothetical protein